MKDAIRVTITFLLLASTASHGYEQNTYAKPSQGFRELSLLSFKGLPRLGEQHPSAPADDIEQHNYSLGLLARLGYMATFSDCYTGMNGYEVRKEKCADTLIPHNGQTQFWTEYVTVLAYSLTPEEHRVTFCAAHGGAYCGATTVKGVMVKDEKNPARPLRPPDEFEVRDISSQIMSARYAGFEHYRASVNAPSDAYHVSKVRLGDYQFDQEKFSFTYNDPRSLFSHNASYRPSTTPAKTPMIGSRNTPVSAQYIGSDKKGSNSGYHQLDLPMDRATARGLVSSNNVREVYAVTKITFVPPKLGPHQRLPDIKVVPYQWHDRKVELFSDATLTDKIGEVFFEGKKIVLAKAASAPDKPTYQLPQNSKLLDFRALSLIRLQQGLLPNEAMDRVAYSVPESERQLWRTYQQRLDALESAKNGSYSTAEQVKELQDRARLFSVNWKNITALTPEQQLTFYNFILGYGAQDSSETSNWPSLLGSVEWGMNIATLFPRGKFSTAPDASGLLADKETRREIQQFLTQAAASQKFDSLIIAVPLRDVHYDQQEQALLFSAKSGLFHARKTIQFATESNREYAGKTEQLVSNNARDSVIYRMETSTGGVGGLVPDPVSGSCASDPKRRSQDCLTARGNFLTQQFHSASLALDKELSLPPGIPMSPERGLKLSRNNKHPGWRAIIELRYKGMDAVPFNYKTRSQSGTSEFQTLYANVTRTLIIDPDDKIWWSLSAIEMADATKLTSLTSLEKTADDSLPDQLPLTPLLYDFLLAKYYPQQLDQHMLEAMLSSRWSYEQDTASPLGGRFFNKDGRTPNYDDVLSLTGDFKKWLQGKSQDLPSRYSVDLTLQYNQGSMTIMNQCVRAKIPKDAPVRNLQTAALLARQEVNKCNNTNQAQTRVFERCEQTRSKLDSAEQALADAQANDCGQFTAVNEQNNTLSTTGTMCQLSDGFNMATLQTQMMACISDQCGEPTATTDMQAYQVCVQSISEELQGVMKERLGLSTHKRTPAKPTDSCQNARNKTAIVESELRQQRCDKHITAPTLQSCEGLGEVKQPDFLPVVQLDLSNLQRCSIGIASYNRKSTNAAVLLADNRPYSDTNLTALFSVENLKFPYDPPVKIEGAWANITATVVMQILAVDKGESKAQKLAFSAKVLSISYSQQGLP